MYRRVYYIIFALIILIFFKNSCFSQYRDPFSEKRKKLFIKKKNHRGLLHTHRLIKKKNDAFTNTKNRNGIIGIDDDPFKIIGKRKFKPTGIEEDSFTKKQRNLADRNKYNKSLVKKKALKSRKEYSKRQKN
jgi:hypothetical protein